jgi:hypothetical protein
MSLQVLVLLILLIWGKIFCQKSGSFAFLNYTIHIRDDLTSFKNYPDASYEVPVNFKIAIAPSLFLQKFDLLFELSAANEAEIFTRLNEILNSSISKELMSRFKDEGESSEYLTLLYRYMLCVHDIDSDINCPNPCNRKPCANDPNAIGCKAKYDATLKPAVKQVGRFESIFKLTYACECNSLSDYSPSLMSCLKRKNSCTKYDEDPCGIGGNCLAIDENHFKCACHPAFTGPVCEHNIACKADNPCKPFKCHKTNTKDGYRCECTSNYETVYDPKPRCIDRDECRLSVRCHNNGTCVNTADGFLCVCGDKHTGKYCERLIDEIDAIQWSAWSEWSACPTTCKRLHSADFEHVRVSVRHCPIEKLCGNDADTRIVDCGPMLPVCASGSALESFETTVVDEEIIHLKNEPIGMRPSGALSATSLLSIQTRVSRHLLSASALLILNHFVNYSSSNF